MTKTSSFLEQQLATCPLILSEELRMFGNARTAISAYQKVGIDAAIEVADPHR
jgi:hypothetical protein